MTKDIGQRIKAVRLQKRRSQQFMAKALNLSQNGYSKMERGILAIRPDLMEKIQMILGTTYEKIKAAKPVPVVPGLKRKRPKKYKVSKGKVVKLSHRELVKSPDYIPRITNKIPHRKMLSDLKKGEEFKYQGRTYKKKCIAGYLMISAVSLKGIEILLPSNTVVGEEPDQNIISLEDQKIYYYERGLKAHR